MARGGALARMLPVFSAGLGGPIGSGRQWWPWISLDDGRPWKTCSEMAGRTPGRKFRDAVAQHAPLQLVGAINAYTARMAQAIGHRAIYLSGGGLAANSLGLPDLGISSLEDVLTDVDRITHGKRRLGPQRQIGLDVVVNNAGIAVAGRLDHVPRERWETLMQLNLLAPMRLCDRFLPAMVE